eukprot:7380462-Prymnesium_polylepis.1
MRETMKSQTCGQPAGRARELSGAERNHSRPQPASECRRCRVTTTNGRATTHKRSTPKARPPKRWSALPKLCGRVPVRVDAWVPV